MNLNLYKYLELKIIMGKLLENGIIIGKVYMVYGTSFNGNHPYAIGLTKKAAKHYINNIHDDTKNSYKKSELEIEEFDLKQDRD